MYQAVAITCTSAAMVLRHSEAIWILLVILLPVPHPLFHLGGQLSPIIPWFGHTLVEPRAAITIVQPLTSDLTPLLTLPSLTTASESQRGNAEQQHNEQSRWHLAEETRDRAEELP